ncbi:MAG: DUF6044 family protein, partial [Lachnospiraceae bacterium]|nr:DUF6044 family protein [Lachnospiraceae bacterium]
AHPLFYISFVIMILEYLVFNARLIMQMLGIGDSYISHRAGMEIEAEEFWSYLKYILLYNDNAATDLHRYWIPVVALTVCFCLLRYHSAREEEKHRARQLLAIVLFMFCLYFFAALWNMEPVVVLREKLGGLGSFQATRVIWLTPACWYFALAVSVDYSLIYILNMTKVYGIPASGT